MSEPARAHVSLHVLVNLRHRASGFSFLPRQPVHSLLAGQHASRVRGRGLDFEELRHYVEGDDTRAIDWLATARLGRAHVRIYNEERDRGVLLLVDQRLSMFFGSRRAMKSVVAAEAAALAAWRVTSLGDRVGAIVFSESEIVEVRPRARETAVRPIVAAIARQNQALRVSGDSAAEPGLLNEALRRAAQQANHDWLICLITDAFGADATTVELVTKITSHNDVLTIFVHDPLEVELPDIGNVVMADAARQIEVDTFAHGLRERFAVDFLTRRDRIAAFSRDRAIPILPISTTLDVVDQLRELLGRGLTRSHRSPA